MDDTELGIEKEDIKEEETGKKKINRKFLIIGIIASALIVLVIIILIFPSNEDGKGFLPGANDSQEDSKGVLSSLLPKKNSGKTTPEEDNLTTVGASEGGGGGDGSENETEEIISSAGKLEIINRVYSYSSASSLILHWQGASEGLDNYDGRYYAMFTPSGISAKIVSKVQGTELDADVRPLNSTSSITLELSLISQSGNPITTSTANELRLKFLPIEDTVYDFDGKEITLTVNNVDYDVREVISDGNGTGIISLPNLSGTYNSGVVYETVVISFS